MLTASQTDKLARLACEYSLGLRPGDLLRIRGEYTALPLMHAAYRIAIEHGAHPFIDTELPEVNAVRLRHAPYEALDFVSPIEQAKIEKINADLWIVAAPDPDYPGVLPKRLARYQKAQATLSQRWAERTGDRENRLRWCAVLYPTPEWARVVRIHQDVFAAMVVQALFLDAPDPALAWQALSNRQKTIADYLCECETVRVVAEGTDITFSTAGCGWFNACGRLNLPDGEVGTSPVEDSASGTVRFSYPVMYQGQEITDATLTFAGGQVVEVFATKGQETLQELLAIDAGACRLGEFAIATNPAVTAFTRCILLDEKRAGTCHFALGRSIPGTGGTNVSALHIDMILDLTGRPLHDIKQKERQGGRVYADGKCVYKDGQFTGPLDPSPAPLWAFWKRIAS